MQFAATILAVAGLAAATTYSNTTTTLPATTTTITTNSYVTVCPTATTFTQNGKTYTATAGQTFTITDCPCTIVKPTHVPHNVTIPVVLTTRTVSEYVTVCPTATTFTQGTVTYTASASETVTVKECPCTVTYAATPIISTITSHITSAGSTIAIVTTTVVPATAVPTIVGTPVVQIPDGQVQVPTSAVAYTGNGVVAKAQVGLAAFAGLLAIF